MEYIQVANEIQRIVSQINKIRATIRERGEDYATKYAEYRKQLGIVIIKLSNGVELELDGNLIKNPKATQLNDIARALCWKEKLDSETASQLLKSAYANLRVLELELTALQSLLKRMDVV